MQISQINEFLHLQTKEQNLLEIKLHIALLAIDLAEIKAYQGLIQKTGVGPMYSPIF